MIAVIGEFRKDLIVDGDLNLCGGRGGCSQVDQGSGL